MEKAKSKKKLIAIIAGAAMAFVLTVVVSVAATLAYFGDSKQTDNASVTMAQALNFSTAPSVTANATVTGALPGDKGTVTVSGTISQSTGTGAFFRFKITPDAANTGNDSIKIGSAASNATAFATTGVTGTMCVVGDWIYLADGDAAATAKPTVQSTDAENPFTIVIPYSIAAELTNTVANQTIKFKVTCEIVQSKNIIATDGTVDALNTAWNSATVA